MRKRLLKLSELFSIKYGVNLELNKMEICEIGAPNSVNFVSRTDKNNGVAAVVRLIEDIQPNPANTISVAGGGSVLATFYQTTQYYSGRDLYVLTPKHEMTVNEVIYYCLCIRANKYRYNYGRQANRTLRELEVPAMAPNWVLEVMPPTYSELALASQLDSSLKLQTTKWKWFRYDSLFNIERGQGPRVHNIKGGSTPVITSTDQDNGLMGYTDADPMHPANVITVARNGSVGQAFYQELPFCSTEDVHVFKPKFTLNKHIAFFMIPLIKMEKYRYSYGRKWGIARMKESLIKLPTTPSGEPDFAFMEKYIRTLPFSKQV